jgi:hypothetical protein
MQDIRGNAPAGQNIALDFFTVSGADGINRRVKELVMI